MLDAAGVAAGLVRASVHAQRMLRLDASYRSRELLQVGGRGSSPPLRALFSNADCILCPACCCSRFALLMFL